MVNQLNSLISGTVRRPIIINGKLVALGTQMLMVRRDNYKVVFLKVDNGHTEVEVPDGDAILDKLADEFNARYGALVGYNKEAMETFTTSVDPFTGAMILKNGVYTAMLDKNDEMHLHDGLAQFSPEHQKVITDFEVEFITNYFEIYVSLLNRRIMSSHIPMKIKSHLVAGLYQPLVVQTKGIDCPLRMSRFNWFFQYINSPSQREELLESMNETSRGLELSVIAMCDLRSKFDTPLVRELNRVHFMYILYMGLLDSIKDHGAVDLAVKNLKLHNALREGRTGAPGTQQFILDFSKGLAKSRQGLIVVRR